MQETILIRENMGNKAVLSRWLLDTKIIAKTLENPWLNNVPNFSCIPAGKYIAKKYNSEKYPDVWELQDVKGRTLILIHIGNVERNTEGCILVGDSWGFLNRNMEDGTVEQEIAVLNSGKTLKKLRKILDDVFTIEVINT